MWGFVDDNTATLIWGKGTEKRKVFSNTHSYVFTLNGSNQWDRRNKRGVHREKGFIIEGQQYSEGTARSLMSCLASKCSLGAGKLLLLDSKLQNFLNFATEGNVSKSLLSMRLIILKLLQYSWDSEISRSQLVTKWMSTTDHVMLKSKTHWWLRFI